MATRLVHPQWSKVDLVDRPADPHATFLITKRDEPTPVEKTEETPPGKSPEVAKKEEGAMPEKLNEEVRKSLDPAVLAYLTELEAAVEKGAGTEEPPAPTDDITKRDDIPADVLALITKRDEELEAVRKSAAEATAVAKAERDARVLREWQDRIAKFDALGLPEETAKRFQELSEKDEELAETLIKSFEGLQEQAATSLLFEEIGKAEAHANSAEAAFETVVKGLQETEKVTYEQAYDLAVDREPALFARVREESN